MERLNINTGLDRFLLIDRITEVDEAMIQGSCILPAQEAYLLMESMAQLGAMHVRWCNGFNRHAFLSGIRNFHPAGAFIGTEKFQLTGVLKSRSSTGFSYAVTADSKSGRFVSGDFLYAAIPYDDRFRRSFLQSHYEKVFSCLRIVSKQP
ncbi:MAG: hypothetical protein ABIK15_15440 [Pseudomonadota bacterium]